jgi:hypothetical protein
MGYSLSSLGNLPVQEDISLYIFVIGGGWKGELQDAIEQNFMELACRIGPNAVIAKGFDSEMWSQQICEKYLGKDVQTVIDTLPALLLTDTHPDRLTETSLRLLVPLRDAQRRFGGIEAFFRALTEFSLNRDASFLSRFEEKPTLGSKAWSVLELKPNLFGFGINLKELVARVQGK